MAGAAVGLQQAADFQAIDRRQEKVEHDQIGQMLAGRRQRFFAGRDALHPIAFLGQVVVDQLQQVFLVVHDEDPFAGHHASPGADSIGPPGSRESR